MQLAPQPILNATLHRYASGMRGVRQTLAVMRHLVNEGRTDPRIRQAATTAIFLQPERMDFNEASRLLEFVQTSIRYTRDVLDVETVSTAEKTLAGRLGDCDDQTVLLAALLESVGYATRFVVAGYDESTPGAVEHVYLQTCIDGQWLDADPTERGPLGWAPPDPVSIFYERV